MLTALSGVTDPLGRATTFGYDNADRVTSQGLPSAVGEAGTVVYGYDANGNLTSVTPLGRRRRLSNPCSVELKLQSMQAG